MSHSVSTAKSKKLADALCSIKAVRNYQRDKLTHGAERVHLYFDDVDGDWLNQFDNNDSSEPEAYHLSQDLCKD